MGTTTTTTNHLTLNGCAVSVTGQNTEQTSHLIAAAPDLLAACISVLENDCNEVGQGVCGHTWELLPAAIALAQGGAE